MGPCPPSTLKSGYQSAGGPRAPPLSRVSVSISTSDTFHKLPMLGKLLSFSGKSSLYRTGSARCSTTLRGIVPKTEANLLMHSDLWGLGAGRAVEQMRGTGWGKEKMFKRLRGERKTHSIRHQNERNASAPRFLNWSGAGG